MQFTVIKADHTNIEKKRFCERTLQLAIEICLDVSQLLVKELKLGLPTKEENVFDKLKDAKIISSRMHSLLKGMKRFRNVLIHKYVEINDPIVYANATKHLKDFNDFGKKILRFMKKKR